MKEKGDPLSPVFTSFQMGKIRSLVGAIGGSPSEVVSRIVMMWLKENNDYVKEVVKEAGTQKKGGSVKNV